MTREQFLSDIVEFRRLMGTKSFWELPESNRQGAISGLRLGYLKSDEISKADAIHLESAILEYERRSIYMENI